MGGNLCSLVTATSVQKRTTAACQSLLEEVDLPVMGGGGFLVRRCARKFEHCRYERHIRPVLCVFNPHNHLYVAL